jgi:7-carboxy-7-deazaguanine synthase (Cx14CxxC type)
MAGCNLWSGREADRAEAACRFCDTDFVGTDGEGGGWFATADDLADTVNAAWRGQSLANTPFVVCTGGEPALQLDAPLIEALHARGCHVAIETNGTRPLPAGLDWICVSPKAGAPLAVTSGDELKLVYPQTNGEPERFSELPFRHFFLQPMDGPDLALHTERAIAYCLAHPRWRLSVQLHKFIGIR